jgi:hypothetical protein
MKIVKCESTGLWIATQKVTPWAQYTATGFTFAGAMISLCRLVLEHEK